MEFSLGLMINSFDFRCSLRLQDHALKNKIKDIAAALPAPVPHGLYCTDWTLNRILHLHAYVLYCMLVHCNHKHIFHEQECGIKIYIHSAGPLVTCNLNSYAEKGSQECRHNLSVTAQIQLLFADSRVETHVSIKY